MILNALTFLSFGAFLAFSFYALNNNKSKNSINLLGGLAMFSGVALVFWAINGCPTLVLRLPLFDALLQMFRISFVFDAASLPFMAVALFVTWSIVEFSHYYMSGDPNKGLFISCLIFFLLFMIILVCSNSLFLLFVGWEGVGILSFVLISWWFTRSDANSAGLQAIIYNRLGDSGIILFLALCMIYHNSWDLLEVLNLNSPNLPAALMTAGLIIAAVGKSAQFLLHPWLPSAMEGPTPVSALLHSSTMVVAGVFLLIRTYPLLAQSPSALAIISVIGSMTAIFAASVALFQYDIKKVVAYSTTSQLGLMVTAVGLGLPYLALFHICTHAFFKALLFLCSGSAIHSFNNEQDLRKMASATNATPFTTSALLIASLALCGIPFLAGFYSKDLILEMTSTSLSNSISVTLALMATLLTAAYSFRVIYYTNSYPPNSPPSTPASEENINLLFPLTRLLSGALIAGWTLALSLFNFLPVLVPTTLKSAPLIVTLIGSVTILNALVNLSSSQTQNSFLSQNWHYAQVAHTAMFTNALFGSLLGVLRTCDQGWAARLGAQGIISWATTTAKTAQSTLSGVITNYLTYSFLLIMISATIWWAF